MSFWWRIIVRSRQNEIKNILSGIERGFTFAPGTARLLISVVELFFKFFT